VKAATTEAPARAPAAAGERARDTAAPSAGEAAAGMVGDVLTLQRQAGNMAVGRLLAGLPGASGERQANATADAATGRKPSAQGEWLSIGPTQMRDVPASVVEVLGRQGHPLDGGLRMEFEQQVGATLGSVRIHSDARAAASARELGARAYTYGPHVVFGAGRFAPATADGRWLLAHELTHVAQQRRGVPALQLAPEGQAVPAPEATYDDVVKTILLSKARDLTLPPLGLRLAVAAGTGMAEEVITELKGAKGVALVASLRAFRLPDVGELQRGFGVGLLSGIVSPVTDLFGIAVLAERLRNFLIGLLVNPASAREGLAADVDALLAEVGKLSEPAAQAWQEITKSPMDALIFILKLPDRLSDEAEAKAYGLGKAGGTAVVDSVLQPFGLGAPEKQEEKPSWLTSPAAALEATVKGGKDWLAGASPWAKIGEKLGYALGWVAIQVILFAFTDGIGDAIQWLAQGLGKIAKALGTFSEVVGRVATKVAEAARAIGEAIEVVEKWFGEILAKLLKPAEKFLDKLFGPLKAIREKLRAVLEKLFGITRKEADKAAELALAKTAKATSGTVDEALERATPKGGPGTAPEPKPLGDTSEALTTPVKKEPQPPPAAEGAGERVVTKPPEPVREPVKGGHHVEAAPEGIELCSPPPCPLLGVIYRKELEANEELATRLAALEKLRATDPKAAAKAAAELRESLEFIRTHPDLFEALPSHVTPQQQARLAELLQRAEDSGAQIGETQVRKITAALGETKDANAVEELLDGLETGLSREPTIGELTAESEAARRATLGEKAERLEANKLQGTAGEANVLEEVLSGKPIPELGTSATLAGSQVEVMTDAGLRIVDHVVELPTGELVALEVKTGGSPYTLYQQECDLAMNLRGGTIRGGQNVGSLPARLPPIRTVVLRR
jgi:Domain of unknown function (DUF4157)/Putative RNase-like toxin, toxin_1